MRVSTRPRFGISIFNCKALIPRPRYKSSSSTTLSEITSLPWLSTLKSTQLQHLARATGIQSSGTKSVLIERISNSLSDQSQQNQKTSSEDPWRILSIDMGIQNLAFAHLVVPCPFSPDRIHDTPPTLNAWRRLAVSEIIQGPNSSSESTVSNPLDFTPALYASTAYKLITTLLATYNPTHILIERQRFRSGGGSAVQEWTIRVGVFEGMLYAILHALRAEKGYGPFVQGVEPKRVVGYLGEREGREAKTAREVKKMKIDVVGRWLDGDGDGNGNVHGLQRVLVDEGVEVADAYLQRWKGLKRGSGVGKLDDLADCLLQGVTWLEWQVMRERVIREGMGALEGLKGV